MAPRPFIPDERRSLRLIFFVSSMLLVGTTVWALWDEAVSRRPWIKYQVRFKQLEYKRVQAQLAQARERLNQPEVQAKLAKLREELRWAEENLKGPAYRAAQRTLRKRQVTFRDINQELQFTKSELDEAYYWYGKAKHEERDLTADLAKVRELEAQVGVLEPRVRAAEEEMLAAKAEVSGFEERVQEVRDKIQEGTKEVRQLEARLQAIADRPLKIHQVVVEGLDKNEFGVPILRVDRCQTCHLGIAQPGFENLPPEDKVFETHPGREVIFGTHPISRFGCSICHQGQGPAIDYHTLVDGRLPDWPHGLTKAYGGDPHFLWDFPMLQGKLVQASCYRCHREETRFELPVKARTPEQSPKLVDIAPALTRGRAMFETLGCHGCHPAEGFKTLPKVGPDLTRIAAKAEPNWLIQWIQNPKSYLPHTRMPNFGLSEAEAKAIAAYLVKASEPGPRVPGTFDRTASAGRGKRLFEQVGCLGCHTMRAVFEETKPRTFFALVGRDFAPDLSNVAAKIKDPEWLFQWLKNPRAFRPATPMPSLRLSDAEASAITAFLLTRGERQPTPRTLLAELQDPERVTEGERLIRKRGCFGCHEIRGFEQAEKIAPELSNFGHKRLLQLSFGDTHIKRTWEAWAFNKLKNPQVYVTDREKLLMPNFGFSDSEIEALRVLLKGFTDTVVPAEFRRGLTAAERNIEAGRRIVRDFNCVGCHIIEARGGDLRHRFPPEKVNEAPPPLVLDPEVLDTGLLSEGEKVQGKWLFSFLKRPVPIRPWLQVRMPTFGLSDAESTRLTEYFVSLAGLQQLYEFVAIEEIPQRMVEAGRKMAGPEYYGCFSCHQRGAQKPEGPPESWAPDLALAYQRLRPEWVVTWLHDPQKIQPGTGMPTFFSGPGSGPPDVLGGDVEKQIQALADYVMSLGAER